jgi:hypothetical protein
MAKRIKSQQPMSTAQQLGSIIKSCRDRLATVEILKNIKDALEIVSKHSWALAFVAAVVLFLPEDLLKKMDLLEIRNNYEGIWWLVLIFCTALWGGSVTSFVVNKISVHQGTLWIES